MLKFGAPRCVSRHGKDHKIFLKKKKYIVRKKIFKLLNWLFFKLVVQMMGYKNYRIILESK